MVANWERKVKEGAPSYSEQFNTLKGCKDYEVLNTPHAKPSREAQARVEGAHKIIGTDIYARAEDRPLLNLETKEIPKHGATIKNAVTCLMRLTVIVAMHSIAAYVAPRTFTWRNAALAWIIYAVPGIFGITLCYHRLLTHRSFKCPKWFEYLCAWLGANAGQGDPIEWVSTHRYHHLHCDTPLDPHSPYEGFWWSHITWLFSTEASMLDYSNANDLKAQWFYRFLEVAFFPWLFIIKPYLTYQYGGIELVAWTIAVPMVAGWHSTFLVNSAAHVYGRQPYETGGWDNEGRVQLQPFTYPAGVMLYLSTYQGLVLKYNIPPEYVEAAPAPANLMGDLSTNCWWVAAVSFGEGWHNSHHAFPQSARHGLEWWEIDLTWYLICALEKLGIVWDVHVPSEKAKSLKRKQPPVIKLTAKFE